MGTPPESLDWIANQDPFRLGQICSQSDGMFVGQFGPEP